MKPDPGRFTAFVKIPAVSIDRPVFDEIAVGGCKACRTKLTATSLTWQCNGDIVASTGSIRVTDSVITIEHDPDAPLAGRPLDVVSARRDRQPPTIDHVPLPCGSKVTFVSSVPDPDKKPITSCE